MKKIPDEVVRPPIKIIEDDTSSFEPIFFIMGIGLLVLFILVGIK